MNKYPIRLIARLDIKGDKVVKGINLEGVRQVGDPKLLAKKYYDQGVDEIIYMDVVASLYERNTITKFIKEAASNIFVPMIVGGGIRSVEDIRNVLKSGADKVAINTAAIKNNKFIQEASQAIGSQSIIVSIEAKKINENYWEAYYDNGREKSGVNVLEWAKKSQELGAGELLITSVDKEGLEKGMDIKLLKKIREIVNIPIIFFGGIGNIDHILQTNEHADGVALANVLHYEKFNIKSLKEELIKKDINVRRDDFV